MAIQWNQVKPDFSGSSTSMKNAMAGISQAGTVFDKMRQTMLDEEQRAAEAAYKQQVFDENVRQFEAQQAYNEEQKRLDRLHAFDLETKRHEHNKAIKQLEIKANTEAKNLDKQRYNQAVAIGQTAYNEARANGGSYAVALDASKKALLAAGLADVKINDVATFVPTAEQNTALGTLSKEYQAKEALNNTYIAANAAKEISGNNSEQYTNFMSRLVPVDGELAIRDVNGNIRALTPEEYSYYDSIANVSRADAQPDLVKKLTIAKEVLSRTGIDEQTANTYANRILMGALGEQNLANDIARNFGLTSSKDIVSTDLQERVNTELSRRKAIEDAEIAQQKALSDDKKFTTFDKVRTEFINTTYKTAGDDGKSKIIALPTNAVPFINMATDTIYNNGGSATQLKRVLGALKQDVIADRGLVGFNPKAAKVELETVLAELKKEKGTGTGKSDKNIDQKEEPVNTTNTDSTFYSDNSTVSSLLQDLKQTRERINASPYEVLIGTDKKRTDVVKEYDELISMVENGKPIPGTTDIQKDFIKDLRKEYQSLQKKLERQQNADNTLEFLPKSDVLQQRMRQIANAINIKGK